MSIRNSQLNVKVGVTHTNRHWFKCLSQYKQISSKLVWFECLILWNSMRFLRLMWSFTAVLSSGVACLSIFCKIKPLTVTVSTICSITNNTSFLFATVLRREKSELTQRSLPIMYMEKLQGMPWIEKAERKVYHFVIIIHVELQRSTFHSTLKHAT